MVLQRSPKPLARVRFPPPLPVSLVVGGVAVNLHGYLRFTGDLDILVLIELSNLEKVERAMKALGYVERLPISLRTLQNSEQVAQWVEEKNLRAFTFMPPNENPLQIDIIIEESLEFYDYMKNKVDKEISGVLIPVVSIDDLITMKKKAGRDKDLFDIEALLELKLSE